MTRDKKICPKHEASVTFRTIIFIFTFILSFNISFKAMAIEGVYQVIIKKQEQKRQSRWSLGEWLATKQRIALMDQWLALNTDSNLFEAVLDYSQHSFSPTIGGVEVDKNASVYNAKFYLTVLGFEWERDHTSYGPEFEKYNISLRLFGTSQQSTHINLLYGVKQTREKDYGHFESQFFGVDGDIYLLSFLGVSGSFEKLSEEDVSGVKLHGESSSYGAFLELFFLRLYIENRKESYFYRGNNRGDFYKEGTALGVAIYL